MDKMDIEALKTRVCEAVDRHSAGLVKTSHEIHSHPELAFHEFEAARILTSRVEAAGLSVERGAYGLDTAYASDFGEGDRTVAILSEYDALPGIGHSCGHNIIATIGLGASICPVVFVTWVRRRKKKAAARS